MTSFNLDAESFVVHSRNADHAYSDGCLHHVSDVVFAC
jgi:hypothetical protein